jgi:acyl-CoA thioester hydrolase
VELKNASLKLLQTIWLEDVKIFQITSVLAFVKEGKLLRIDEFIKEFMKRTLC